MKMAQNESFKPVQVWLYDKELLERVHKKTGVNRAMLMHLAIDWLRRKYRLKDEPKGE